MGVYKEKQKVALDSNQTFPPISRSTNVIHIQTGYIKIQKYKYYKFTIILKMLMYIMARILYKWIAAESVL